MWAPISRTDAGRAADPRFHRTVNEKRDGTGMCPDPYGTLGGDGDWAKIAVLRVHGRNDYHLVCRIWSRAWPS